MLANCISHFYDLRGPSVALDTACSSDWFQCESDPVLPILFVPTLLRHAETRRNTCSHLGCQSLRAGESRASLVAITQLMICPEGPVCLSRLGLLSSDSRFYAFDDQASGFAGVEGT